jgi:hypothetical protein
VDSIPVGLVSAGGKEVLSEINTIMMNDWRMKELPEL